LGGRKLNHVRRLEWFHFGTQRREILNCFDGEQLLDYCVALRHTNCALDTPTHAANSKVANMSA